MSNNRFISYDAVLKYRARKNRKKGSLPEARIWKHVLSRKQTGYKFTRERPIDHFIVDFYCAELLVAVEIDGDDHSEKMEYDEHRTGYLAEMGIQVIRYSNRDVMNHLDGVFEDLKRRLDERKNEIFERENKV